MCREVSPNRTIAEESRATDALAERSKAVAQGAIPKGRGFEPHRRHFEDLSNNGCARLGKLAVGTLAQSAGLLPTPPMCAEHVHKAP